MRLRGARPGSRPLEKRADTPLSAAAPARPVGAVGRSGSSRGGRAMGYTCSGIVLDMQVAHLIRDARRRAGLSQAALAARAKTSQPAVARYEAGTATPSLATLERLLAASGNSLVLRVNPRPPRVSRRRIGDRSALLQQSRGRLREAARRHGK